MNTVFAIIQAFVLFILFVIIIWVVIRIVKLNIFGIKDGEYIEENRLVIYKNNKVVDLIALDDLKLIKENCIYDKNGLDGNKNSTRFYLVDSLGYEIEVYNSIEKVKKYLKIKGNIVVYESNNIEI